MSVFRPTFRQIGAVANVSHVAVSLALRGHPSIPERTRERIRRIAEEMGYRPDPEMARLMEHLRKRRQQEALSVIAFLNPSPRGRRLQEDAYVRSLYEGARQRADELGYKLEEFWLKEPGMTARRFDRMLHTRNIRGLLIPPLPKDIGHLSLDWNQYAAVALTHSIPKPHLHRVCPHHSFNMRLVLRELRRLGYRRIGFVIAKTLDKRVNHDWTAAFLAYQQEIAQANRVPRLQTVGDETKTLPRWLAKYRPDTIISAHSDFCEIVRGAGQRIPEDIGFVTMAESPNRPELACVHENGLEVGRAAVNLVASQLAHNEFGLPKIAHTLLVEGSWDPGSSVRRVAG
jgi:LacI family transcriptional regulator